MTFRFGRKKDTTPLKPLLVNQDALAAAKPSDAGHPLGMPDNSSMNYSDLKGAEMKNAIELKVIEADEELHIVPIRPTD